jgi:S-adenosylmethionine:tRNA ribosyltransferase-isomerase
MKVSKKPPVGTVLRMDGGFTATLLGRWPRGRRAAVPLRLSAASRMR